MTTPADLLVLVPQRSSRLDYILHWMFDELDGSFVITTDTSHFLAATGPKFQYGDKQIQPGSLFWPSQGLIFQASLASQRLDLSPRLRILVPDDNQIPGDWQDPFSDCFYLLSRYEEYLPFEPDQFGRFRGVSSTLFRKGLLTFPAADKLKQQVQKQVCEKYPMLRFRSPEFKVTLTFDIDQAFAHRAKSLPRRIGSLIKSLFVTPRNFRQELAVLLGKRTDPFDVYDAIFRTKPAQLPSIFFLLCSTMKTKYDHQVDISSALFKGLVQSLANRAMIGLHPSFYTSNNLSKLQQEKQTLQAITRSEISRSRQHYLRLTMPQTYRNLVEAGISEDYSMGYDNEPGFRAGTCRSFTWYDLLDERATNLKVYPISFMELSFKSHYDKDFDSAWSDMKAVMETVKEFSGHLVPVWHNHAMSDWAQYANWIKNYDRMIKWIEEHSHGE